MINKFIKHKKNEIEIIGKIPTRGVFMLCIFNLLGLSKRFKLFATDL